MENILVIIEQLTDYGRLADLVSTFHMAWTMILIGMCIIIGVLAALKFKKTLKAAVIILFAMVFSTVALQLLWLGCPLTLLEEKLRNMNYEYVVTSGSWTADILHAWMGWNIPVGFITASMIFIFVASLILFLIVLDEKRRDNMALGPNHLDVYLPETRLLKKVIDGFLFENDIGEKVVTVPIPPSPVHTLVEAEIIKIYLDAGWGFVKFVYEQPADNRIQFTR